MKCSQPGLGEPNSVPAAAGSIPDAHTVQLAQAAVRGRDGAARPVPPRRLLRGAAPHARGRRSAASCAAACPHIAWRVP